MFEFEMFNWLFLPHYHYLHFKKFCPNRKMHRRVMTKNIFFKFIFHMASVCHLELKILWSSGNCQFRFQHAKFQQKNYLGDLTQYRIAYRQPPKTVWHIWNSRLTSVPNDILIGSAICIESGKLGIGVADCYIRSNITS